MTTIVLVHGAFRGAWAWERVVPLLREDGHDVHAWDLPGAGERYTGEGTIRLGDCTSDLADRIVDVDLHDITLVGHSQGGFVARAATPLLGGRLRVLGLLDAPDPRHGEAASVFVPGSASMLAGLDPGTWIPPTTPVARNALTEADVAWMEARLTPSPVGISLDPVDLTGAADVPTRYAFCRHTPGTFPSQLTRERANADGTPYELLDAGHDAPISHPALVADWIAALT